MNEYEVVGKGRTVLPLGQFAFYTLAPMVALYVLATIPIHILGTRIKQLVSFPLMVCLVVIPYLYRDENDGSNLQSLFIVYCDTNLFKDMFCVLCQALPFSAFQRLSDIFWIHPFLYKKDAYLSPSDLSTELWACIRRDKKIKENKEKKITAKDKVKLN